VKRSWVLASVAFAALLGVGVWLDGNGDRAARQASAQFGDALTRGAAPPEGAAGYVRGVHAYFGAVTAARVIDARNHHVAEGGPRGHDYVVADVLLASARGPAVLELSFDKPSAKYDTQHVTDVHELTPDEVPDDALDAAEDGALAQAFAARGGWPVTAWTLLSYTGEGDS